MFGKRTPPAAQSALADRVRQLAERKAPAEQAATDAGARYRQSQQRAEREPLFRQGTLTFQGGQRMSVAIKNLSDTGARIEFFTREFLPPEVFLTEPLSRLRRHAQVVWQGDGVAGLHFIEK